MEIRIFTKVLFSTFYVLSVVRGHSHIDFAKSVIQFTFVVSLKRPMEFTYKFSFGRPHSLNAFTKIIKKFIIS